MKKLNYVLAIKHGVYGHQSTFLAYQIAQALVDKGHTITQIFFFLEGVNNANAFINMASDEINLMNKWQQLSQQHHIPLHLCISAAQRRGIVDEINNGKHHNNLATSFILAGLGEFNKALLQADRLLTL